MEPVNLIQARRQIHAMELALFNQRLEPWAEERSGTERNNQFHFSACRFRQGLPRASHSSFAVA